MNATHAHDILCAARAANKQADIQEAQVAAQASFAGEFEDFQHAWVRQLAKAFGIAEERVPWQNVTVAALAFGSQLNCSQHWVKRGGAGDGPQAATAPSRFYKADGGRNCAPAEMVVSEQACEEGGKEHICCSTPRQSTESWIRCQEFSRRKKNY